MHDNSDSTGRRPEEHLLFAIAFLGFTAGAGGIILSSPAIAFIGAAISLLALWCFLLQSAPED
jgi:hypothetical protein